MFLFILHGNNHQDEIVSNKIYMFNRKRKNTLKMAFFFFFNLRKKKKNYVRINF